MSFAITRFRGDDVDIPYEVQNGDGGQRNITGETVTLIIAQTPTGTATLKKDGVHTAPISGQGIVTLTSADTATLTGEYFAFFEVRIAGGKLKTFADGGITFKPKPA